MSTGPFRPILPAQAVEQALVEHCREWLPSYIAEVCRQAGLGASFLSVPETYFTFPEFDKWPEQHLPCVIVTTPGATGFDYGGDGSVGATFTAGVGIVAKAPKKELTNRNCKLYAAALRASIIQNINLGGRVGSVELLTERYDELDSSSARTLGAGVLTMNVRVENVADMYGGPEAPPVDPLEPPDDYPIAETYNVQVDKTEEIS